MRTPTVYIPHGDIDGYSARTFGLRGFLSFRNDFVGESEAAPIYTGITIVRSGSGTRSVTTGGSTTTQTISYSKSHTFNRTYLNELSLTYSDSFQFSDGLWDKFYDSGTGDSSKSTFKHYIFGLRPTGYYSNPKKHHLKIDGVASFNSFNYGTETVGANPPTNLSTTLEILCPYFGYANPFPTLPDILPNEYDRWNCSIGIDPIASQFGVNITGYSATKWRDLRGSYTLTVNDSDLDPSWDSNSVVHTAQWTIF